MRLTRNTLRLCGPLGVAGFLPGAAWGAVACLGVPENAAHLSDRLQLMLREELRRGAAAGRGGAAARGLLRPTAAAAAEAQVEEYSTSLKGAAHDTPMEPMGDDDQLSHPSLQDPYRYPSLVNAAVDQLSSEALLRLLQLMPPPQGEGTATANVEREIESSADPDALARQPLTWLPWF
eukprot:GHVU01150413.1.p1 GENE.GHVU01150413.1~~GHVU01150413.1.p1  ORF type:complete len:178 (+),score=48.13 GHVU01150413.1:79-612(+)